MYDPACKAKALSEVIAEKIRFNNADRAGSVNELYIVFCLYFGNDPDMGDLIFLFTGGKEKQVARLYIAHRDFLSEQCLGICGSREHNIYRTE